MFHVQLLLCIGVKYWFDMEDSGSKYLKMDLMNVL